MNYLNLIYSSDFFLFHEKVKEILMKLSKKGKSKEKTYSFSFDLETGKLSKLLEELNTPYFFETKKIIIKLDNWFELNVEERKTLIKSLKSTKNPTFLWKGIDTKKKIIDLEKIADIHSITKINKSKKEKFILKKLEENHVFYEKEIIEWISLNTFDDFFYLNNEINKIIFYYFSRKKLLKLSEVKQILTPIKTSNFFNLFFEILKNNKKQCFKIYKKLSKKEITDTQLILVLETYLWLIKKIYYLSKLNLNYRKIAQKLGRNPFFILNLEKISKIQNERTINFLIEKWIKLEYNIKKGFLTPEILFKHFLIS